MLHMGSIRRLGRLAISTLALLPCAGMAIILPPLWEGVGRDLRPVATNFAVLTFFLATGLRWRLGWDFLDFMLTALSIEAISLLIISHFSGFTGLEVFHWFNMEWLKDMSRFTILPWFLGFGVGSLRWIGTGNDQTDPPPSDKKVSGDVTTHRRPASPRWLLMLCVLFLAGTLGGFIAAALLATANPWPDDASPPPLYVQLVSTAIICLGLVFEIGLIHTVYVGTFYSGIARRQVNRVRDPLHFWLLLGAISLLALAPVAYGLHALVRG